MVTKIGNGTNMHQYYNACFEYLNKHVKKIAQICNRKGMVENILDCASMVVVENQSYCHWIVHHVDFGKGKVVQYNSLTSGMGRITEIQEFLKDMLFYLKKNNLGQLK